MPDLSHIFRPPGVMSQGPIGIAPPGGRPPGVVAPENFQMPSAFYPPAPAEEKPSTLKTVLVGALVLAAVGGAGVFAYNHLIKGKDDEDEPLSKNASSAFFGDSDDDDDDDDYDDEDEDDEDEDDEDEGLGLRPNAPVPAPGPLRPPATTSSAKKAQALCDYFEAQSGDLPRLPGAPP